MENKSGYLYYLGSRFGNNIEVVVKNACKIKIKRLISSKTAKNGEMAEWSNAVDSKSIVLLTGVPRVRIPISPPI